MFKAKVFINQREGGEYYLLGLKVSENLAKKFLPGQFLKIRVSSTLDPLFPRPFTIHAVEGSKLYLLYRVVGKGTQILSKILPEEELKILGPLGKPFPEIKEPYIICAGGAGIAGFGYLLQKTSRLPLKIFYGVRTKEELVRVNFYEKFHVSLTLVTEDGSYGKKGLVTEALEEELENKFKKYKPCLLACGPLPMLKSVLRVAKKYQLKTFLVLETFLACGTGFCRGCVIPLRKGGYTYLCIEGPTFLAEELDLERVFS